MISIKIKEPKQARSQDKCERIKKAFIALSARRPVSLVSTDDIAKHARVSIGTLYQFYKNRESIAFDVLNDIIKEQEEKLKGLHVHTPELIMECLKHRHEEVKRLAPVAIELGALVIPPSLSSEKLKSAIAKSILGI